jgi:AcrR family transcriptional regulator
MSKARTSPLSPETSQAILDAAWRLICERGRADVSLGEIATAAGVTRQSIYIGFGGRAGLLIAMARNADNKSEHSRRMRAISDGAADNPQALHDYVEAWLAHLPEIYPVGVLLSAAAVTDGEAAAVFEDRMIASLHGRYRQILKRLARAGHLAEGWSAERAADLCWSLTHIEAWRQLVVERGWSPAAFLANRQAIIAGTVLRGRGSAPARPGRKAARG